MSFTKKSPSETYKDIIYVDNSNSGIDSTARAVKSGSGASSVASISDRTLSLTPSVDSTSTFKVADSGGTAKLDIDTTNDTVKALGVHVNTQYAYFGVSATNTSTFLANTHHVLAFQGNAHKGGNQDDFTLGSGTDPATSFTTADGANTDSSLVVPCLWYVPDGISIDSVKSLDFPDTSAPKFAESPKSK